MELREALDFISKLRYNLSESRHFSEQCRERNLDLNEVQQVIRDKKILGIVEQSQGLYKLWFAYKKDKDLNIIINIHKQKLVTIFPCDSLRRKR